MLGEKEKKKGEDGGKRKEESKGAKSEKKKETERGNLEDCVPLARCSARGGLLPLETTETEMPMV